MEVKLGEVEFGDLELLMMKVEQLEEENERLASEIKLLRPLKFERVLAVLDQTTASIGKAVVTDNQITTSRNINEDHPFFLTHTLEGR